MIRSTLETNKANLIKKFAGLSQEKIYHKLIQMAVLGNELSKDEFSKDTHVPGCQSVMHIKTYLQSNKLKFKLYSDALISKGIAVFFENLFTGCEPDEALDADLSFLKELQILGSLSPSRSNGLISLYNTIRRQIKNL